MYAIILILPLLGLIYFLNRKPAGKTAYSEDYEEQKLHLRAQEARDKFKPSRPAESFKTVDPNIFKK